MDFDYLRDIAYCSLIFGSGFFVSFYLTSFIYKKRFFPLKIKRNEIHDVAYYFHPGIPYTDKWNLNTLEKMEKEEREELVGMRIGDTVFECTPNGDIYMNYDAELETFRYWADRNVNYDVLATVSRKYRMVFDCIDLCDEGDEEDEDEGDEDEGDEDEGDEDEGTSHWATGEGGDEEGDRGEEGGDGGVDEENSVDRESDDSSSDDVDDDDDDFLFVKPKTPQEKNNKAGRGAGGAGAGVGAGAGAGAGTGEDGDKKGKIKKEMHLRFIRKGCLRDYIFDVIGDYGISDEKEKENDKEVKVLSYKEFMLSRQSA
jgi:hypothetical protein